VQQNCRKASASVIPPGNSFTNTTNGAKKDASKSEMRNYNSKLLTSLEWMGNTEAHFLLKGFYQLNSSVQHYPYLN
jgi:hypothetical protein